MATIVTDVRLRAWRAGGIFILGCDQREGTIRRIEAGQIAAIFRPFEVKLRMCEHCLPAIVY